MASSRNRLRGTRQVSSRGRVSGNVALGGCEGEKGAEGKQSGRGSGVCGVRSQQKRDPISILRARTERREADYLDCLRTITNNYNKALDRLTRDPDLLYDVKVQRDLARETILEVEAVLDLWKVAKRAKKRG